MSLGSEYRASKPRGSGSERQRGGPPRVGIRALESAADRSDGSDSKGPEKRGRSKSQVLSMSTEHHTKIIASLVPDEIIYDLDDTSIRKYDVALMLGDVSGFTDLTVKYNKTGKGGPSRLTEILNGYIGAMVQEILSSYGDVLKFSGDAFLAWWKSTPDKSMSEVVNQALDAALMIQKNYGRYETDVGVTLKVKLAVAAGQVMFSIIGSAKLTKHYIIVGQPIFEVKLAEYLCSSGDVMISPSGWQYINILEYLHEFMPDGEHIKVLGMGPSWRNIQKPNDPSIRSEDGMGSETLVDHSLTGMSVDDNDETLFPLAYSERVPRAEAGPVLMEIAGETMENPRPQVKQDEYSLRPSVNDAAKNKMKEALRPFIFPPVMKGVDMDEPLEYLTEMRQVVIMFVNVITTHPEMEQLIRVVDQSYQVVCTLVNEHQGSVNKVSMFDKDLMFLVIFGLRGYKHDLESQTGLKCAAEVYHALMQIEDVSVTSAGVTTGMTYCGVVGHTLRREYTVIGIPVNKAARLMMAYPGRVTCDKETFIHSKMEARHFMLQEPKELKGLASVGPIYEFKEQSMSVNMHQAVVSKFPLLGRNEELQLCSKLLEGVRHRRKKARHHQKPSKVPRQSVLLMEGEPRQGKTRLLDEMAYSAKQGTLVNRISLTSLDRQAPYNAIRMMFAPPLGLSQNSSLKEREDKLVQRLHSLNTPQLYCSINNVFNVNFEFSAEYLQYNMEERESILQTMLKQLVHKCFKQMWIIAMDDCEFADPDSWKMLPILIEEDCMVLLMTVGNRRELPECADALKKNPHVFRLALPGIGKWFIAGLACQILDVRAIPPELEKVIQARSNGNPGWVESYLVSLIQAGGLIIRSVPKSEIGEMGLVCPSAEMMMRGDPLSSITSTPSEEQVGSPMSEDNVEQTEDEEEEHEFRGDGWKMYQFSYQDSVINLLTAKRKKKTKKQPSPDNGLVAICTLAPNFSMAEVDTEVTMDVMIIKMFDSLTSYEQLLLKSSSVLGETFPRNMLLAILSQPDIRPTALAIKRLFEIRVLGCASGDYNHPSTFTSYKQRIVTPNLDQGLRCDCQGLIIDDAIKDLPNYASCALMRFRVALFRDTTYNLLTNIQKKEYHLKAVKFLERETRRCKSCGGGHFVRILGYRHDDGLSSSVQRKDKGNDYADDNLCTESSLQVTPTPDPTPETSAPETTAANYTHLIREEILLAKFCDSTTADPVLNENTRIRVAEVQSIPGEGETGRPRRWCGLLSGSSPLSGPGSELSLTRSFSSVDFSTCQCSLILATMYQQLIEHCFGAQCFAKVMEAKLEYAAVCIKACNIPQAMQLLDRAQTLLANQATKGDLDNEDTIPTWKVPFIMGKIHMLQGYSRLELGQLENAYTHLYLAMREFGFPFPVTRVKASFMCFRQMLKLKVSMDYIPHLYIGTARGYAAAFSDQMSECLGLLFSMFKLTNNWKLAHLAAAWGLNKALESDQDFYGLCTSYSNMLDVAHHYADMDISWRLENGAMKVCHRKTSCVESQELQAVARLYYAVFTSRLHRAEIEHACSLGFKTLRIITAIQAMHLRLTMLPPLIQALIIRCRLPEAVSLLQELEFASGEDSDKSGSTWYHALCLDLQLDTGYTVMPFIKCERFFKEEGENRLIVRDPDAHLRFFTNMWLWCVRNEDWEAATMWIPHTRLNDRSTVADDSIANVMSSLRLLEGLILYIVGKVDNRNIKAISETYIEISVLLDRLEKAIKTARIALPRFMHMQAYYRQVRYHDPQAMKMLLDAKLTAQKQGNLQEAAWAEHSEKVWRGTIAPILRDFWKEHCDPDNLMDWHEAEMNTGKMVMFSLPAPRYSNL